MSVSAGINTSIRVELSCLETGSNDGNNKTSSLGNSPNEHQNGRNSDNDNIMMKNLLSLTSKSQDNDSNRSSEPLKSEAEEEEEEEKEEEGGELEKDKGVCLDLSRFHEEDIDIKKFNYDVILGFVSKGMSHIHYKQPKLMTVKFPFLPFYVFQPGRW